MYHYSSVFRTKDLIIVYYLFFVNEFSSMDTDKTYYLYKDIYGNISGIFHSSPLDSLKYKIKKENYLM